MGRLENDTREENAQQREKDRIIADILRKRNRILIALWVPGDTPRIPLHLDEIEPVVIVRDETLPPHWQSLMILPDGRWGHDGTVFEDDTDSSLLHPGVLMQYAFVTDKRFQVIGLACMNESEKLRLQRDGQEISEEEYQEKDRRIETHFGPRFAGYMAENESLLLEQFNANMQTTLISLKPPGPMIQ